MVNHYRFGHGLGSDLDRLAQALQDRLRPFGPVGVDGHDCLAFFDPVADIDVEDETASEGDRVFFFTAAGTGLDGG
jgi:hypothetical protein